MNGNLQSFNPANNELVGEVETSTSEQIHTAVSIARAALPAWQQLDFSQRAEKMQQAADALLEESEQLGTLLHREMGKPLSSAIGEVRFCARGISKKTDEVEEALKPEFLDDGQTVTEISYEAYGVCAAITPWNYPMSMVQAMVLPALLAGNTVVLKPSEETPLIAQAYVDVCNRFLTENVLQIVHGDKEQGEALVESDVNLIAFTGSRNAGKKILKSASSGLKRVILELGGKDPLIVLEDADLQLAAKFAAHNSFENAGQMCVSTERIYVEQSIAEAFEKALIPLVKAFHPDEKSKKSIGPMIADWQRDHVLGQINAAVEQGAKIISGENKHQEHYISPMIISQVDDSMAIMREETFGPISCIRPVANAEEAIRLTNDNPYGLGAAVYGSHEKAKAVARQLDVGMVGINKGCFGASGSPWVGAKQSGYGYHGGIAGDRQFTQVKTVSWSKG